MEPRSRSEEEFDRFFREEFAALHRYVRRRLGKDLADDVAAQTFTEAFAHWSRVRPDADPRPWLYGIAANLIRAHWRREERQLRAYARSGIDPVLTHEADDVIAQVDARGEMRALSLALAKLSAEERDVLLLTAWCDFRDVEIASALGQPIGTVKSRLHRARERTQDALRGHVRQFPKEVAR